MSWLDDLKKGMEKGYTRSVENEKKYTERLTLEREEQLRKERAEQSRIRNLRNESDKVLFDRYNSRSTSASEKEIIKEILYSRGYVQNSNGSFNRRL